MTRLLFILCLMPLLAVAQPALPTVETVSETVTRVSRINGVLVTNSVVLTGNKPPPYRGYTLNWEHDPALRQFVSFRAYARTNLNTNSEVLWGTTTNWWFDYTTSVTRPMMFYPRVVAEDVALQKLSDGRPK